MNSCWYIEFEDGHRMIISEEYYKEEVKRNWAGRKLVCEAHWFDIRRCRERNTRVRCYGL